MNRSNLRILLMIVAAFLLLLPDPASAEKGETPEEETVLISFVGDCSIGDAYSSVGYKGSYHSVVKREGYAWPFSLVCPYLSEDDLTVANLEVVLTEKTRHKDIRYPLRAAPDHVNVLLEGSVEAVNTVNNHCYDFLRSGYMDTLETLDRAGIDHFGSVYFQKEDGFDQLLVRTVKGIRFGFAGFTYPQMNDTEALFSRITRLKEEEHCDIVAVSVHWGRETHLTPEIGQVNLAKALIDAGADVVYGHHPHVLQPLIFYRGKPIMLSTGNFTFGTMSDVDPHTGIFRITFRKTGDRVSAVQVQVIPCMTSGSYDYRPYELTEEEQRKKTFKILRSTKKYRDIENVPLSFLETGIVFLDESGNIIQD